MKTVKSIFLFSALFITMSAYVNAQSKSGADYFLGKWNVLVKGTPQGDAKLVLHLEDKEGKLAGVVLDTTGNQISKLDSVNLAGEEVTVYFNASGYDVYMNLKKKDEDHATGGMLGMFDALADRVKVAK
ncbi:hypothetical protein [Chitinophaga pinensis]|uniref:Uncharacterized protein n=1 Tax=Chitinophaga pinensis (strain ATCC 43595 / DSM 2588 / LMG 13176 / NBRC 15968 / NCIMB 11800 / UQM 2034) TaxID=485918 RepID=A0A979G6X4_CHIPD|nr:hypothetical protein [Chitinophaga pinensis]ACU61843.1 hypothetical protein Cpin_4397 [Chitinophaga pinensis DSM 2588]